MECGCHTTVGFEAFDAFLRALNIIGTPVSTVNECEETGARTGGRRLRWTVFGAPHQTRKRSVRRPLSSMQLMIVEEYLAVDDRMHDGISRIAIEVYPTGQRPDLESRCEVIEKLE